MLAKKMRKTLALFLALTMVLSLAGLTALAGETAAMPICGKEAHMHNDACYAAACVHGDAHDGDCGYQPAVGCGCEETDDAGNVLHSGDCGFCEETPCAHSCTVESGCLILSCGLEEHEHDDSCYPAEAPLAPMSDDPEADDVLTVADLLADESLDQSKTRLQMSLYYYQYDAATGTLDTSRETELSCRNILLSDIAAGKDFTVDIFVCGMREREQYAQMYQKCAPFWFVNSADDETGYLPDYNHMGSLALPSSVLTSIPNADLLNMEVSVRYGSSYYIYLHQALRPEGAKVEFDAVDYDLSIAGIEPVAYQPTSSGVSVVCTDDTISYDPATQSFTANLLVTIGADAPKSIHVNLIDALGDAMNKANASHYNMTQPGDTIHYNITIVNESGRNRAYVDGSAQLGTLLYETDAPYADAAGFEGYPISRGTVSGADAGVRSYIAKRIDNAALVTLLGSISAKQDMSDANIGAALRDIGYGDETMTDEEITLAHLGDYYLSYLNYAYETDCASFQELSHEQLVCLTSGSNNLTLEETCPDVVEGLYYHLYGAAYTFDVDGSGYASLYARMQDNAALDAAIAAAVKNGETYTISSHVDGELYGNAYQMTQFGFGLQFQLYTPTTSPSYDYYTVTVNYFDKATGEKLTDSFQSSSIREGRDWDFADKKLDAITADGVEYTYDSADGDALTGTNIRSDKVINLYYVTETEIIPDPDVPQGDTPDLTEEIEDEPVPGSDKPGEVTEIEEPEVPLGDAPNTGDSSLMIFLVLTALLSAAGAAALLLTGRKRAE